MLFSYICFTIFYYLTKNNLHSRKRYAKSDLFCTTSAHWYKSLPIISAWGSLSAFFQKAPKYDEIQSSIASSLLHLVKTIEHGPDIKSKLENDRCKSDLTIAQL